MNKPDTESGLVATEEQIQEALKALDEFDRTGLGYTLEDFSTWAKARRTDPDAKWPAPKKMR